MIEELKQLLTMVHNVPDMVLHVLLGFAAYKIIIFLGTSAGIYGTIRLGINRWHDYKIRVLEAPKRIEYQLRDKFITADGTMDVFLDLLNETRNSAHPSFRSEYIHKHDVEYLRSAIREKKVRDAEDKTGKAKVVV